MANDNRETKAQRVERLKRAKNPWECLEEIRKFAKTGHASIPPEWLGLYFRWWGVYTQGDGNGVLGGRGGEGKAIPCFMVRIRIPNGILSSHQLRTIADISARHGGGMADLTVRQNIQLHWVTIEALPDVLESLFRAGLTSMGSCGDDTRNMVGCPVAGVDASEVCDASPLILQATKLLNGNPAFYNLPRKFKVCITGCRVWCSYPEINDVGLTAVTRPLGGDRELGFSIRIGGGLSTDPHLGLKLNAFLRWDQVVPVIQGVAEVFRDSDVLRDSRERARLKFLFLRHGWTEERFREELQRRVGFTFEPAAEERPPDDIYRDHVGIHRQRQTGLSYIGASVLRGRLTSEQMHATADLAERFATGEIRTTNMQNLLIINVPNSEVDALARGLHEAGISVAGSNFERATVACVGSEFCKLAITETKDFARTLVGEMERRLPAFDQQLRLDVTGCPNSCGQHWIADIGLEGKKARVGDRMVDAYYFCVGGAIGLHRSVARPVGYRCLATEVPTAIERLLRQYLTERLEGENLRHFFARHTEDQLRTFLAGHDTPPVPREAHAVAVPHGVEG